MRILLIVLFLAGCAPIQITRPECGAERPQDCEYLLKVYGEKPWF